LNGCEGISDKVIRLEAAEIEGLRAALQEIANSGKRIDGSAAQLALH
jgi:hypothetical protein